MLTTVDRVDFSQKSPMIFGISEGLCIIRYRASLGISLFTFSLLIL